MTTITRFAPSPTGYLHLGGARTALYSWLYAKKMAGEFILRVEDTDRERSTQEAIDAIFAGMSWLQLDADQPPTFQTQRFAHYQKIIDQLVTEDKAYRCYCSSERLDSLREQQMNAGEKPRYDGHCRHHTEQQPGPYVIRFKTPKTGNIRFYDHIRGDIEISNEELDDLIILRSNGTPTYNFCVVVDDSDMNVTHVIRGEDHINNTPRQINILHALNRPIPEYAHVPMILGSDGKKLSKRHGAVSVIQYQEEGFLPQAMLNYLVRLGWSHGDQEIFSIQEMIQLFDLKEVNKAPSAFNYDKLVWLNQHYIRELPSTEVAQHLAPHMQQLGLTISQGPELTQLIAIQKDRVKTLKELAQISTYFYQDITEYDEKAAKKHLRPVAAAPLAAIREALAQVTDWQPTPLQQVLESTAATLAVGLGKVGMPLRVAITGGSNSPSLNETLALLDQQQVLIRIDHALAFIRTREQGQAN